MSRRVLVLPWCKDFVDRTLTDVHQHVCVRETLHRTNLSALHRWDRAAVHDLATIVLFENFPISDGGDAVVVELQPPCLAVRLDESKVMAAVEITGVHEHTVQLIHPWVCTVCTLLEELAQVNLVGEFMTIVYLGSE